MKNRAMYRTITALMLALALAALGGCAKGGAAEDPHDPGLLPAGGSQSQPAGTSGSGAQSAPISA